MRWLAIAVMGLSGACSRPNPAFDQEVVDDATATATSSTTKVTSASTTSTTTDGPATTSSTGTSVDTGIAETGVDPTTTGVGSTGMADTGPDPRSCCTPTMRPGCVDAALSDCVCEANASCCNDQWGLQCTEHAALCGACGAVADCCAPVQFPGCNDDAIAQCVCEQLGHPQCCSEAWTSECVAAAVDCRACDHLATCCTANALPGCADPEVAACVCNVAPKCCLDMWTPDCVDVATEACGLAC